MVMVYILSHDDTWEPRFSDLKANNLGGKIALRAAFQELRKQGYARLVAIQDKSTGDWKGKRYFILEEPVLASFGNVCLKNSSYSLRNTNTTPAKRGGGIVKEVPPPKPTRYAIRFNEALIELERGTHLSKRNLSHWARSCQKLVDQLKGDWKRLRRVMNFHFDHWTDDYVPQCFNFFDFNKKFFRIEEAMDRKERRKHSQNGKHALEEDPAEARQRLLRDLNLVRNGEDE